MADLQGPRYGLLLLLLAADYLVAAFLNGTWVSVLQIVVFLMVTGLAVRNGLAGRRITMLVIAAAVTGSVIAVVLALTQSADRVAGAASLWAGLLLLLSVVLIVRRVLAQPSVTIQSIFGAVSAYMIIGLMFAAFYAAIGKFSAPFFVTGPDDARTYQYFSFTTLTTLGYGDFTAASNGGRSVAVMEAMLGQVFLATLVARLVAAFQPRARQARRGGGRGVPGSAREPRQPRGSQPLRSQPRGGQPRASQPRGRRPGPRLPRWRGRQAAARPGRR